MSVASGDQVRHRLSRGGNRPAIYRPIPRSRSAHPWEQDRHLTEAHTLAEVFAGFGACGWATLVVVVVAADEPDNATTAADAAAIAT
jgi:hypothetical protein